MSRSRRASIRPDRLWCALLLFVLLLQGVAMHAAAAAVPAWTEVCSAAGTKYVPAALADDAESGSFAHVSGKHCAECVVSAPFAAPPPASSWWFGCGTRDPHPAGGTIGPLLPAGAWSPVQARAPPSLP